jgi:AcrR family transcriptional regulator
MTEEEPTRRERKKKATRQALQSAALRLVAEHGLDKVTVEQIAEAVDLSYRTFFNYFSSKEEAVVGASADKLEELRQAFAARPATEPPLVALRTALHEITEGKEPEWERMRLMTEVIQRHPELLAQQMATLTRMSQTLAEVVAARTGTSGLYPHLLAGAGMTAFRTATLQWHCDPDGRSWQELLDEAFAHLASGFAVPAHVTPATS